MFEKVNACFNNRKQHFLTHGLVMCMWGEKHASFPVLPMVTPGLTFRGKKYISEKNMLVLLCDSVNPVHVVF